jgi:formylglycine-generating enzyme required for sulfatase activity
MNTKNSLTSTPSPPWDSWELTLAPGVRLELVRVPEGPFLMGSPEDDPIAYFDEHPQHPVYVPEFYIGKYEVTLEAFRAFVEATGHETTAESRGGGYAWMGYQWGYVDGASWTHPQGIDTIPMSRDKHPVTLVSWDDALAFCEWASDVTGFDIRLPTEAEWEKAARGSDGMSFPWGEQPPSGGLANYADWNLIAEWADEGQDDGYEFTAPVGTYPEGVSPYGAHDMAGNVWEWTSTLYVDYPYVPDDGREDPNDRKARVLHGGSYLSEAAYTRTATRLRAIPLHRDSHIGFRVAASAQ